MAKENEGAEDLDLEDLPGDVKEGEKDETDWKAIAQKNHGIAQRYKTKLEKAKDNKDGEGKPNSDKKGDKETPKTEVLDRMDKAILRVEKITSEEEIGLVESIMKDTGKTLEQVLESKYFQSELKEMRELKASEDATPTGTKRANNSARDTVDYWIAKGELPPASQPELRQKVVNAKIAKEKAGSNFSATPVQ